MAAKALADKVAIITGGSKGIGRATALRLAKDGANVVINYASDSSAASDLVKEIGKDQAIAIQADAGSVAGAEKIVDETVKQFGKIDILIPNAGVLLMKDLENTTEADFDRIISVNVKGPYFLCQVKSLLIFGGLTQRALLLIQKQKAVPHMAAGSHIILVSTSLCTATTVAPNYLLYNTTKGAIEQMVRVMSKDLARKGICVNAIAPGPTGTELFFKGKSEQLLNMLASAIPMGRIGNPEEVADAFAFLASNDSRWVTGQTIRVNGGMA